MKCDSEWIWSLVKHVWKRNYSCWDFVFVFPEPERTEAIYLLYYDPSHNELYIYYNRSHNEVNLFQGFDLYSLHWFPFDFKENVKGKEKSIK